MKRDGGWTVELIHPLRVGGKAVEQIDIRPPELDHVIRWNSQTIPSTLALMSELTGVPEAALRTLCYPDVDRVMLAFANVIKGTSMLIDFEKGTRPIATPKPVVAEAEPVEVMSGVSDDIDPRFPKVAGPVRRFAPPADDAGDDALGGAGGPEAMRKVS